MIVFPRLNWLASKRCSQMQNIFSRARPWCLNPPRLHTSASASRRKSCCAHLVMSSGTISPPREMCCSKALRQHVEGLASSGWPASVVWLGMQHTSPSKRPWRQQPLRQLNIAVALFEMTVVHPSYCLLEPNPRSGSCYRPALWERTTATVLWRWHSSCCRGRDCSPKQ